jgi:hypothetical protein
MNHASAGKLMQHEVRMTRRRLPSPAIVIALLALFIALSGTAVAAGVVPLAKRALVADNAKKLNGVTLKGVVGGIAAAAPALVNVQTQSWSLNGGGANDFSLACPSGAKAIAGGFDATSGTALALDTRPSSDQTAWKIFLGNASDSAGASGTLYAVCLA